MNAESDRKYTIGVTVAAVLIFLAAFMPWGEIQVAPTMNFGSGLPIGEFNFGGMQMSITVTGWNGNVSLGGLKLPNWLVVLAAAGVALLSWLNALSVWKSPVVLALALTGYGIAHAGISLAMLMGSGKSSAGVGVILTVLAFMGMLYTLVRQSRAPEASMA